MADLVSFLVEFATSPELQGHLSPEILERYGITDPATQQALLNRDKAALMNLIGEDRLEMVNNGTVYVMSGDISGQFDQVDSASLFLVDATADYPLSFHKPDSDKKIKARVISAVLNFDLEPTPPDADRPRA